MNAIFQLLNPNNTVSVNRPLAHAIGLNETVIYGALISKFYYYSEREMLDNGWFYSTAPDLQESTSLSEKQQKRSIDNLVKAGLIRCELRGMPAKRSFYIVEDIELIQKLIAEGENTMHKIKPAATESYERKRKSSEPNENTTKFLNFITEGFRGTVEDEETPVEVSHNTAVPPCSDKRAEQAPTNEETLLRQKVGASSDIPAEQLFIKTKGSKPKGINPINQSITESDGIDRMDFTRQNVREKYELIIRENISYDYFLENKNTDIREIDELVALMVEVICSNKPTIRVNGAEMSQEVVKAQFLKLNESHIEYVLSALKKNTSDIRNIRNYLITALYNAPSTISSFWNAEVNHDMYGK